MAVIYSHPLPTRRAKRSNRKLKQVPFGKEILWVKSENWTDETESLKYWRHSGKVPYSCQAVNKHLTDILPQGLRRTLPSQLEVVTFPWFRDFRKWRRFQRQWSGPKLGRVCGALLLIPGSGCRRKRGHRDLKNSKKKEQIARTLLWATCREILGTQAGIFPTFLKETRPGNKLEADGILNKNEGRTRDLPDNPSGSAGSRFRPWKRYTLSWYLCAPVMHKIT